MISRLISSTSNLSPSSDSQIDASSTRGVYCVSHLWISYILDHHHLWHVPGASPSLPTHFILLPYWCSILGQLLSDVGPSAPSSTTTDTTITSRLSTPSHRHLIFTQHLCIIHGDDCWFRASSGPWSATPALGLGFHLLLLLMTTSAGVVVVVILRALTWWWPWRFLLLVIYYFGMGRGIRDY